MVYQDILGIADIQAYLVIQAGLAYQVILDGVASVVGRVSLVIAGIVAYRDIVVILVSQAILVIQVSPVYPVTLVSLVIPVGLV